MHRLLAITSLVLVALAVVVSSAFGATAKPKVTSFTPPEAPVNSLLTLRGKNFLKGARHNTVYFTNAITGKTVRAHPRTATTTKITVVVPSTVTKFMTTDVTTGQIQATRFQLSVYSKVLGPKTSKSNSPLILPPGNPTTPGTPGGTGGTGGTGETPNAAPEADCDNDGIPNSTDNDDDNDALSDDTEKAIGTDACKPDTDGDGVGDAYEYYASLDLNGNPNYAGKRPYPNPVDGSDAAKDFDGDGLTMTEEYSASLKFGTATTAPLTYSDGNQTSVAPANSGVVDLDQNGRITDDEKDADNDGLANWLELAKTEKTPPNNGYAQPGSSTTCAFSGNTGPQAAPSLFASTDRFTVCNGVTVPNGNTFTQLTRTAEPWYFQLDWLSADSDGDGVTDAADDQDHDGLSNLEEINAGGDSFFTNPEDPCDPNENAPLCERHAR